MHDEEPIDHKIINNETQTKLQLQKYLRLMILTHQNLFPIDKNSSQE